MMRLGLICLAFIACFQSAVSEAEANSCEDILNAFQFAPEYEDPVINERLREYKREHRALAVPHLRAFLRSIESEIERAESEYSAATQVYREQYSLWERVDPRNMERRASDQVFLPLRRYIGGLNYYRTRIHRMINRMSDEDRFESRARKSGMVGDVSGTLTDAPLHIRNFSQGNFSTDSFSGGAW